MIKAAAIALWIVAAGVFGALAPVTTPSGWFILVALATAPPLVLMYYWRPPLQTLSQIIQKAIR